MTYGGKLAYGKLRYGSGAAPSIEKARNLPTFLVSSLEDLPAPSGGKITLPVNTCWAPTKMVDISPNRLVLSESSCIEGTLPGDTGFITSSSSALLSLDGAGTGNRGITGVGLINNGTGGIFDFVGSGGFTESILIDTCSAACATGSIGSFQDLGALFMRGLLDGGSQDGVTLSGTIPYIRVTEYVALLAGANYTGIKLVSTLVGNSILISQSTVVLNAATTVGLDIDGAVTTTRALISENQFPGVGAALVGGIDPSRIGWKFAGNQGIRDSAAGADLRYFSPTRNSTVGLTTTWQPLQGPGISYTLFDDERFIKVGVDQLQYVGLDPVNITVTASFSAEKNATGANNQVYGLTVFKNNTATDGTNPAIGSVAPDEHQVVSEVNNSQARALPTTMKFNDVVNGDIFQIAVIRYGAGATGQLECYAISLTVSE